MKFILLVACVFTVLVVAESSKWDALKNCKKDGDKTNEKECFSLCALKAFGKVNDKAEIDYSKYSDDQQSKVKECDENNKQDNLCERAAGLGKCLRKLFRKDKSANNEKYSKECAAETNTEVSEKDAKHMFKFDDKKACYHRCMLIKSGWINEDNEANTKKVPEKLGKNKVDRDEVIKKCTEEHKEEDKCMQAIQRARCVMKAIRSKKQEE